MNKQLIEYIEKKGGKTPFADFMHYALYAPNIGYYTSATQQFGHQGDFVTAPEISPLFAQSLANQVAEVLSHVSKGSVLEFGAGTGKLAADLLLTLETFKQLPEKYYILEVSAHLKQRQQALLKARCAHLLDRIVWLNRLPTQPIKGIVLANEVLDAMPVHKFQIDRTGHISEYYVTVKDNKLAWMLDKPSSAELEKRIKSLHIEFEGDTYTSEINLLLPAWVASVADCLQQGLVLLIDYGFPQREYYHSSRSMGTIMCHYQHRSHPDPLIHISEQDITAHVDFTLVAEAAEQAELTVAGYTNQAYFLMNCGIATLVERMLQSADSKTRLQASQQLQTLTMPQEMGELFKVMALTKDISVPLLGFSQQDSRSRL